jgi:hypothetical protein
LLRSPEWITRLTAAATRPRIGVPLVLLDRLGSRALRWIAAPLLLQIPQ